jgi:hypothetical protein
MDSELRKENYLLRICLVVFRLLLAVYLCVYYSFFWAYLLGILCQFPLP